MQPFIIVLIVVVVLVLFMMFLMLVTQLQEVPAREDHGHLR